MAAYESADVALLLSEPRLNPYLRESHGDIDAALALYAWNVQMAAASFETIAHLEVVLRNALDSALRDYFREASVGMPWFLLTPPLNPDMERSITAVRDRLRPLGQDTRHQIIAGLSFGFWSDAWPFYVHARAYVCQPNRWFRPVDRIAFYADQEVKPDIPRIVARRDNVPWTDAEAQRLERSDDRTDRKIATVIRDSRAHGWAEGSYQVFLLTSPGDGRHRTLPHPIPHQTAGRGSAFVQRQRYVSLHALETAATTADL